MKRVIRVAALVAGLALLTGLGGCVYPAYYGRPGVVYSDQAGYPSNGNAAVDYDDDADYGYVSPGYYSPGWYGYGYGWPYVSLGFYGGYWGGRGGYYRGPWRGGYYHHGGGWGGHGGNWGGSHSGGHGGSSGGHSSGSHH